MKCYECGKDASAMVRNPMFFYGYETTTFYCKECFDKHLWRK